MNRAPFFPPVSIEILEGRIAPAAVLTFTDFDGDTVKITSSKGTVADLQAALNDPAGDGASLTLGAVFKGANISIVAGATDSDAALVNISFINATGVDLGNVNIDGELNRIVAGDANSGTAGLRSLRLGTFGVTDVTPGAAAEQFDSKVIGAMTSLNVRGEMKGAYLQVLGSDFGLPGDDTGFDGKIGSIFLNSLTGTARVNGGAIFASGNIGNVTVVAGITGLAGANARVADGQDFNASIIADGAIGNVTIGGDLTGGDGDFSGHITSGLGMKALKVGNLIGGYGDESGVVGSSGTLGKVTIAESVIGGSGYRSGSILSLSNMQAVTVGKTLEGGSGEASGWIAAGGTLTSVTIGELLSTGADAIIGGGGEFSGSVGARGSVGAVKIFGNVLGGEGPSSGQIVSAGRISGVTIEGDLVGGSDFETGSIGSLLGLGPILIKGSIIAGSGERSALITTQKASYDEGEDFIAAPIASVTVLGSIDAGPSFPQIVDGIGGGFSNGPAGPSSAGILASGDLGTVVVKGDVRGGFGLSSGRISSTHDIKSVTIDGSLAGGDGDSSGVITASGVLGPVTIGSNLEGGFGDFSGVIFSATKIAKVTIGGNLFGGSGFKSGVIETSNESSSSADIGAIFVRGSVVGDNGDRSGSIISDGKIASVTIGDPKVIFDPYEDIVLEAAVPVRLGNGSLIGGSGDESGSITTGDNLGPVKIKYELVGGSGVNSGRIFSGGKIASLDVGVDYEGSIIGGVGDQSNGSEHGQVYARESIAKVVVGGSLDGGNGDYTAHIRGRSIGSVIVGDSVLGGGGEASGAIFSYSLDISSVDIRNSLAAGPGVRSGWIAAQGSIGSVDVDYVSGSSVTRAKISAGDTIGSVTIGYSISYSSIFAGYDIDGFSPINADAQIGTIHIKGFQSSEGLLGGNMTSVNIVAGAFTGLGGRFGQGDGVFGTSDDVPISSLIGTSSDNPKIYSKIAKVIIAGDVLQAASGSGIPTHYGIVAQQIGSILVGGVSKTLKAGPINDPLSLGRLVGTATDTTYGEVPGSQPVLADPILIDQFDPDQGQLVSAAFDSTTGNVWIYSASASAVRSYSQTGAFLSLVTRPGESANDVDIEFAPEAFTLGGTLLPAGTMLFINGESGFAEIYAVDKTTGTVLASLNTSFGASHVVGGAYHPGRNTFFLVQDQVPGGVGANRIAEIDPLTGNVVNTFQTTGVFAINFGDLEVSTATGNLFVVSSDEARVGEFTPAGVFLQYHPLPAGVSSLSGIGFNDAQGQAWVSSTNGTVYRLGNIPEPTPAFLPPGSSV